MTTTAVCRLSPFGNEAPRRLDLPSVRFPPIPQRDSSMVEKALDSGSPFRRFCFDPLISSFCLSSHDSLIDVTQPSDVDVDSSEEDGATPVHAPFMLYSMSSHLFTYPLHFRLFPESSADRHQSTSEWAKLIYGYRQCNTSNDTTWHNLVGDADPMDPTHTFGLKAYPLESFCRIMCLLFHKLPAPGRKVATNNVAVCSRAKRRRREATRSSSSTKRSKSATTTTTTAAADDEDDDVPLISLVDQPIIECDTATLCLVQFIATALLHRFITCRGRWLERWHDSRSYPFDGNLHYSAVDHLHPQFMFCMFRHHDSQHVSVKRLPAKPHIYKDEADFMSAMADESSNVFCILLIDLIHSLLHKERQQPVGTTRWLHRLGLERFVMQRNGLAGWFGNTWNILDTARYSEMRLWCPAAKPNNLPQPTAEQCEFEPDLVGLGTAVHLFTLAHMQHVSSTSAQRAVKLDARVHNSLPTQSDGPKASVVYSCSQHDQKAGYTDGMMIERHTLVFHNNCRSVEGQAYDPVAGQSIPGFMLHRSHIPQFFTHPTLSPTKTPFCFLKQSDAKLLRRTSTATLLGSKAGQRILLRFATALCWFCSPGIVDKLAVHVRTIKRPNSELHLSLATADFPLTDGVDQPAWLYTYYHTRVSLHYPHPKLWAVDYQSPIHINSDTLISLMCCGATPFVDDDGGFQLDFFNRRGVDFLTDDIYFTPTNQASPLTLRFDIVAKLNAPFLELEEHITLFEVGKRVVQSVASYQQHNYTQPVVTDVHIWWVYTLLWTLCDSEQDVFACLFFLMLPRDDWLFILQHKHATLRAALLLAALKAKVHRRRHLHKESFTHLKAAGIHSASLLFSSTDSEDEQDKATRLAQVAAKDALSRSAFRELSMAWNINCRVESLVDFDDLVTAAFKQDSAGVAGVDFMQLYLFQRLYRHAFRASLYDSDQIVAPYNFDGCVSAAAAPLRHVFADLHRLLSHPSYFNALTSMTQDTISIHPMYEATAVAMLAFSRACLSKRDQLPFSHIAQQVSDHLSVVVAPSFTSQHEKAEHQEALAHSFVHCICSEGKLPSADLIAEIRKAGHTTPKDLIQFAGRTLGVNIDSLRLLCEDPSNSDHILSVLWRRNFSGFMNSYEPGSKLASIAAYTAAKPQHRPTDPTPTPDPPTTARCPHTSTLTALTALLSSTGLPLHIVLAAFDESEIKPSYDLQLADAPTPHHDPLFQFAWTHSPEPVIESTVLNE